MAGNLPQSSEPRAKKASKATRSPLIGNELLRSYNLTFILQSYMVSKYAIMNRSSII